MAKSWSEIKNSQDFLNETPETQRAIAEDYFNKVIRPQVEQNGDDVSTVYNDFTANALPTSDTASTIDSQLVNAQNALHQAAADGSLGAPEGADNRSLLQKFSDRNAAILEGAGSFDYAGQYKELKSKNRNPDEEELFQERRKQIEEYLPQAQALKAKNPEQYPMDEVDLAGSLAMGKDAKDLAEYSTLAATLPVTGGASVLARLGIGAALTGGSTLAGQAADAAVSDKTAGDAFSGSELATSAGLGAVGGAAAPYLVKGVTALGSGIGNKLADLGIDIPALGITKDAAMLRRYGDKTNPDTVQNITQSNITDPVARAEAQKAFTAATTDDAGNSLLVPSQVFNDAGSRYINAERRALNKDDSIWSQRNAATDTGDSIKGAIDDVNVSPDTLQNAGVALGNDFHKEASKLYTARANEAQQLLDQAQVGQLKMPRTKQVAQYHLDENERMGDVNLSPEVRRTLDNFNKADLRNIQDLDKWKRTLTNKADIAFRQGDYTSRDAIREVLSGLKQEADATISSINPTAGSLYREADEFYGDGVNAIGKKSVLSKIANDPNEQAAENKLFNPTSGDFNTGNVKDSVLGRIATNDSPAVSNNAVKLGQGLSTAVRNRAVEKAETSGQMNFGTLAKVLRNSDVQSSASDELIAAGRKLPNAPVQQSISSAISDAADITKLRAKPKDPGNTFWYGNLGGGIGWGSGVLGGLVGGPGGYLAGHLAGAGARKAITEGVVDGLRGTNRKASQYIDWLTKPDNAAKVQESLALKSYLKSSKGKNMTDVLAEKEMQRLQSQRVSQTTAPGSNASQADIDTYNQAVQYWNSLSQKDIESLARKNVPMVQRVIDGSMTAAEALGRGVSTARSEDKPVTKSQPISADTQPHPAEATVEAQPNSTDTETQPEISLRNEALYNGIVHAETGGLKDPWIRTGQPDSTVGGTSTAYGPAQITGSLMEDMVSRYPQYFSSEELEYANNFIDQAKVMAARPDDPTFGYGKKGVMGSTPQFRKTYNSIAKKIIEILDSENGGDYYKLVQRWRGLDDPAYSSKLSDGVNAYLDAVDNSNRLQG